MNKKKVKELIEKAISELNTTDMGILYTQSILEEVLEELSKSDWNSVEDRLPEFGKEVYVRVLDELDETNSIKYGCAIRFSVEKCEQYMSVADEHNFCVPCPDFHITHWKPIEKLEK